MKKLFFLLIPIIICSCAATKGVYDPALKSTEPLNFTFSGSASDFESYLKRMLVSNAFSIADFDKEAGIVATDFKELIDDEKFNTTGSALIGVNIRSQKGKLVFVYEKKSDTLTGFNMACFLSVDATYSQNDYQKSQVGYGGDKIAQGHPLFMKYKNLLLADQRVKIN